MSAFYVLFPFFPLLCLPDSRNAFSPCPWESFSVLCGKAVACCSALSQSTDHTVLLFFIVCVSSHSFFVGRAWTSLPLCLWCLPRFRCSAHPVCELVVLRNGGSRDRPVKVDINRIWSSREFPKTKTGNATGNLRRRSSHT